MTIEQVLEIQTGSHWSWAGGLAVEELDMEEKYGFSIGWRRVGRAHIVHRYVSGDKTEVYLSDSDEDARSQFRTLVAQELELPEGEALDENDRKMVLELLRKYRVVSLKAEK